MKVATTASIPPPAARSGLAGDQREAVQGAVLSPLPPALPPPPSPPASPSLGEGLQTPVARPVGRTSEPAAVDAGRDVTAAGRERVLSLDGGASSGLCTLELVAALERQLRRGNRTHQPLAAHFDRLVGTSVGAIIAAALAFADPETGEPRSAKDAVHSIKRVLAHAFRNSRGVPPGAHELFCLPTLPVQELAAALCELGFDSTTRLGDALVPIDVVCYPSNAAEPEVLASTEEPGASMGLVEALVRSCNCAPFGKGCENVLYNNPTAYALTNRCELTPGERYYVVSVGAKPWAQSRTAVPAEVVNRQTVDGVDADAIVRRLEVQIPQNITGGPNDIDDCSTKALIALAKRAVHHRVQALKTIARELLYTAAKQYRRIAGVPDLSGVCTGGRGPCAGVVRVSGRQLFVDGNLYEVRGVCWNPVPIGGVFPQDLDFAGFADGDIALMHRAAVNTVRVYAPLLDRKVLDKLYGHGIRVINPVYDSAWVDLDMLADRVNQVKDHPAILMWALGNEWNFNGLWRELSHQECVESLRAAARLVHELDPNHPVATVYGEQPTREVIDSLPEIDAWGLNVYRFDTFGSLFREWSDLTDKPMFLGEFGADAWDSRTDECNPQAQEYAVDKLVGQIFDHSSARRETGNGAVCIGGCVFEFRDEWWKHLEGSPDVHDTGGVAVKQGGPYPDSVFNEEWFGLVTAEGDSRPAWEALTSRYHYYRDTLNLPRYSKQRNDKSA